MNIVIQGRQGCGKTTTAEHIAMMFRFDRVAFINEYPAEKLCFDTVMDFIRATVRDTIFPEFGRADKILIVFDMIPNNEILNALISRMNKLKNQFAFVDTIYIIQFKLNIT